MFFCNNTIDDERKGRKKKASMIKLRILRCVKIKCFFFSILNESDKNNRVVYRSKKTFSFYPSTAKAAVRGDERVEKKRRRKRVFVVAVYSQYKGIGRERDRQTFSTATERNQQSVLSLPLFEEQRQWRTRLYLQSHIQHQHTAFVQQQKLLILSIINLKRKRKQV